MKLDIGCGRSPLPGYVTVDLFTPAEICAPMWAIPLPPDSVEEIYCSCALEHITRGRVVETLAEWKRLVKPDGVIRIEVPDLLWCCENFISAPGIGRSMDNIFGGQSGPGDFHQMGFTDAILRDYVREAELRVESVERVYKHEIQMMIFIIKK